MNKTMIYGMLTALFALASCMGNGNPVSLSDLEGEWNVVELAGQSVNTKQQPFIGFDTREMRVYGYGGCNRLMGSFEWSDESARMVMDKLASTMMVSGYGAGKGTFTRTFPDKESKTGRHRSDSAV